MLFMSVFSTCSGLVKKRIRFTQGFSLVLYLYFRIFYFCILEFFKKGSKFYFGSVSSSLDIFTKLLLYNTKQLLYEILVLSHVHLEKSSLFIGNFYLETFVIDRFATTKLSGRLQSNSLRIRE